MPVSYIMVNVVNAPAVTPIHSLHRRLRKMEIRIVESLPTGPNRGKKEEEKDMQGGKGITTWIADLSTNQATARVRWDGTIKGIC